MNLKWYLHRLSKMNTGELLKRFREELGIRWAQLKYRNPEHWPYRRFAEKTAGLVLHRLPSSPFEYEWTRHPIYNLRFNLTKPIDWHFSEQGTRWPASHYAKIDYRPGNPYGDVRINWELNRLQFLPAMALTHEHLARTILIDWLTKNPYLHGPGYLASMEVALRWIPIYWAACLLKQPLDKSLNQSLCGLAVASGKFIESRFSTHSSAGNHLIVEAVGLCWIGRALENTDIGRRWVHTSRGILAKEAIRQINPDGTNKEQSFWYLGFVLDAFLSYFLIEDRSRICAEIWERVEKMLEFLNDVTQDDGMFPDYGDREIGRASCRERVCVGV